uniref:Uncharacterized protein n=1 Tax=Anguilla anguilla TaxID=7936 RepID=A0A0E9PDG7_ANGAN
MLRRNSSFVAAGRTSTEALEKPEVKGSLGKLSLWYRLGHQE